MKAKNKEDFLAILEKRSQELAESEGAWGRLQPWVNQIAEWIGVQPWRVIIPVAILGGITVVGILRGWVVVLVSWLQGGF